MKKFAYSLVLFLLTSSFAYASANTPCMDADEDGYIATGYCANSRECMEIFQKVKTDTLSDAYCSGMQYKKGFEPEYCDQISVTSNEGLYDNTIIRGPLKGKLFNPGQTDIPNNGVDENCDGMDGDQILNASNGMGDSFNGNPMIFMIAIGLIVNLATIISVIVLIYGTVLYFGSASNDEKRATAKKLIIGALIAGVFLLIFPFIRLFMFGMDKNMFT